MIIKALKAFSDGVLSLHEGAIADVPDAKAEIYIRFGYAIEYTEGGDIDLSAYAKKTDLKDYTKISDLPYATPEQFGAKGDGVTDDSDAFMQACQYADENGLIVKLTKLYLFDKPITFNEGGTGKYLHLTIEGNSVSGTNANVPKFIEKPMNIKAKKGFTAGSHIKLKNVGFLDYGITIAGLRTRLEGCIFNRCETAITLVNNYIEGGVAQWKGEIFIDNCDFSNCTVSIESKVSDTTPINYVKDSRIVNCTAIYGDVFLKGRFSAWQINNNHIYSTYSIKDAKFSSSLIENNYFDTNNIAIDMEVGTDTSDGAIVQVSNNQFFKSTVTTVDGAHVPVCKFIGSDKDKLVFTNNHCTKNYTHNDEYFVVVDGGLNINYSDNVSNINFINMVDGKPNYTENSNLIVMPKHTNRADMMANGVLDKPIICLTFDGWTIETINTIAPYLQEKGLPFTVFYGECDNTPNTPKTQADIEAIHTIPNYGGEVQFYTSQDYRTFAGTTNYREQWAQLKSAYDRYLSWGLPKPKVCSLAGGVWSDILVRYLHELGIKGARASKEDPNPNLTEESLIYGSYQLQGNNYSNRNWDILNTSSWYNSNKFKIFTCHSIMSGDDSASDVNLTEEHMKAFIDDIANSVSDPNHRYTVMTFSELWDYIHFPRNAKVGQHCLIWEGDGKQHEYVKISDGWREITI